MTNDIVALIDYYERERELERPKVIEALQYAFISAYRKMIPGADATEQLRATIDTKRGRTTIFATLTVVEDADYSDHFNEVPLSLAQKKQADILPGQLLEFNVTPKDFGRIATQTARQTMMQRLRMAEKEKIYDEFKDRAGDIVSGEVHRFEKKDILINLGKFDGRLPHRERVSTEDYSIGDRIRVYVLSVENDNRGPEVILSRSHPNFVRRLFESEVSEIADGTIELRGIAREAGYRTKIAVSTHDEKVDPVGACVGMRGARVKNIVRELNNERVDVLHWNDDPSIFVAEALKPTVLRSINIDEEKKVVSVTVNEEDLSKAIGRRGQNARLTSRLMGWDVQISKDETEQEQFNERISDAAEQLAETLEIDSPLAETLFLAGGASLDLITQMPAEYIAEVLSIDLEKAQSILERASLQLSNAPEQTEE